MIKLTNGISTSPDDAFAIRTCLCKLHPIRVYGTIRVFSRVLASYTQSRARSGHYKQKRYRRCIRVLATETLGKISVARTRSRTLGRDEEPLLSSGWTLIGSELASPNFN